MSRWQVHVDQIGKSWRARHRRGLSLVAYKRSMVNPGIWAIGAGTTSGSSTTDERPSASMPVVRNCVACSCRGEQGLPSLLRGSQPITTGIFPQPRLLPLATGRNSALLEIDLPIREVLEHFIEDNTTLNPRQCGTQAEMRTMPEGQVLPDIAVDVEVIGVRETRSSRFPEPWMARIAFPPGTTWPCSSTS